MNLLDVLDREPVYGFAIIALFMLLLASNQVDRRIRDAEREP